VFEDLKFRYTGMPNPKSQGILNSTVAVSLNTCLIMFRTSKHVARK